MRRVGQRLKAPQHAHLRAAGDLNVVHAVADRKRTAIEARGDDFDAIRAADRNVAEDVIEGAALESKGDSLGDLHGAASHDADARVEPLGRIALGCFERCDGGCPRNERGGESDAEGARAERRAHVGDHTAEARKL